MARIAHLQTAAMFGGSGGGPVVPAWVQALAAPSGDLPTIALDFKNGRYWGNGAETTADVILEHNANWGDFNPASIQAGLGLAPTTLANSGDAWPQIVASFYGSLLTTGATVVLTGHAPDITGDSYFDFELEFFDDPGFNSEYGAFVQDFFTAWVGSGSPDSQFVQIYNAIDGTTDGPLGSAAHDIKLAYNILASSMGYSLNGGSVTSISSETPPTPWTNIALTTHNQTTPGEGYMTFAVIYPPQPVGDLIALSAP